MHASAKDVLWNIQDNFMLAYYPWTFPFRGSTIMIECEEAKYLSGKLSCREGGDCMSTLHISLSILLEAICRQNNF